MGMFDTVRVRLSAALSPKQMTQQISRPRNQGADEMFNLVYKPDALKFTDYDKMLTDPQIKSGYELLRMFLLSRKIVVTPASKDQADVEIAEEIESMIEGMKYPMRKVRNDMYSALIYGYSVSEFVWKMEDGDKFIGIERIRPIPIDTLDHCFRYDDMGDVDTIVQTVDSEEIPIDADKCLIYTYDEQFGEREGTSILDAVYDNWYMKQKILKWWNVFLQKHEGPTLVGKVENPNFKDEFRMQLDEVQEGRTNMTIGTTDSVEVLESAHRGEGFQDAIHYHDIMIFRKMNIGTMILGQEDGKGAYAQSQTQADMLNIFLDGVHEDIATELQIKINELVDMNWQVDDYPQIGFETFEDKDLLTLLAALQPYVQNMAIDPQDSWFKHLVAEIVSQYAEVDMSDLLEEEEPGQEQLPGQEEQQVVQEPAKVEPTVAPSPEDQAAVDKESNKNVIDALNLPQATTPGE